MFCNRCHYTRGSHRILKWTFLHISLENPSPNHQSNEFKNLKSTKSKTCKSDLLFQSKWWWPAKGGFLPQLVNMFLCGFEGCYEGYCDIGCFFPTKSSTFGHFFKRFYLFIHERHRERDRDTGRGRSRLLVGSQMWDLIPGPQGHNLSQRQMLYHWTI